jgi:hypothetical protein
MAVREQMVQWANWWADPGEYRVYPSHLIEFFKGAGCEDVPSERDATESMKLDTGVYLYGTVKGGVYTGGGVRHWCGIFACYLLRNYCGVTGVKWSLLKGGLQYDGKAVAWRGGTAGMKPGDIAVISKGQHHFIVTEINEAENTMVSVDGNAGRQSIKRKNKFIKYSSKSSAANYNAAATSVTPYGYYKILI